MATPLRFASARAAALFVALAATAAACTTLLGKFEADGGAGGGGPSTATGGGTGGVGGAVASQGGSGGTGGGDAPPNYDCYWQNATQPIVVAPKDTHIEQVALIRRGSEHVRVFSKHVSMNGSSLVVYDPVDPVVFTGSIPVGDVLHGGRLGQDSAGVLGWHSPTYGKFELRMYEHPDGAKPGGFGEHTVLKATDWTPDAGDPRFEGKFVVADPTPGNWRVHYVVRYRDQLSKTWVIRHGFGGPGTFSSAIISSPTDNFPAAEMDVFGIFHAPVAFGGDDKAYAYLGGMGSELREYAVRAQVEGPVLFRPAGSQFLVDAAPRMGGFNVAVAGITAEGGIVVHTDRLGYDRLGKFTGDEVAIAASFTAVSQLPTQNSHVRWYGNLLTLIGRESDPKFAGEPKLGFAFFDSGSRARGRGTLDLELPTGVTHLDVLGVATESMDSNVDTIGGDIHVAWIEEQESTSGAAHAIYYNVLECGTVAR